MTIFSKEYFQKNTKNISPFETSKDTKETTEKKAKEIVQIYNEAIKKPSKNVFEKLKNFLKNASPEVSEALRKIAKPALAMSVAFLPMKSLIAQETGPQDNKPKYELVKKADGTYDVLQVKVKQRGDTKITKETFKGKGEAVNNKQENFENNNTDKQDQGKENNLEVNQQQIKSPEDLIDKTNQGHATITGPQGVLHFKNQLELLMFASIKHIPIHTTDDPESLVNNDGKVVYKDLHFMKQEDFFQYVIAKHINLPPQEILKLANMLRVQQGNTFSQPENQNQKDATPQKKRKKPQG